MLFQKKFDDVAKPVFTAVARTSKFFVDGVDVLDVSNRKFLKNIRLKTANGNALAPLFRIFGKTCKFNAVVTPLFENVLAVCFLSPRDYRKAHRHAEESVQLNNKELFEWCKMRVAKNKQDGYVYSKDCSRRALISFDGNVTKVEIEALSLFPQMNAFIPQSMADIDKFVWIFEHENTSFYGDNDSAMQDLFNYFAKFE